MPSLKVAVFHKLGEKEALSRVRNLAKELKAEFGDEISKAQEKWQGDICNFSFTARGFTISGKLKIKSDVIEVEGNIPWALLPWKGKVEAAVRKKIQEALAK